METSTIRDLTAYSTLINKLDSGWASTPARYRAAVSALGTLHLALAWDSGLCASAGLVGPAEYVRARSEDCRARLARF